MWTIESVRRDCQGDCGSPRSCKCEPAYAYRLVNAKQNYSRATPRLGSRTDKASGWRVQDELPTTAGEWRSQPSAMAM